MKGRMCTIFALKTRNDEVTKLLLQEFHLSTRLPITNGLGRHEI